MKVNSTSLDDLHQKLEELDIYGILEMHDSGKDRLHLSQMHLQKMHSKIQSLSSNWITFKNMKY